MNKKGVSAVVATVLIVMITVAAAGLLWGIVAPILKTQIAEKESCVNAQVSMSVDEDSRYTCVSSDNGTAVRVHRGSDEEEWRAVQVIYTDSNGNSQTVEYTSPPGINSEKVFKNVEIRDVISIAVVPILANNGNDLVCAKVVEIAPVKNCSSEVSTTITNDGTSPEYSGSGGGITGSVIDNCYGDSDEDDIYEICTCEDLQAVGNDTTTLSRNYTLSNDIDCSDTINWNDGNGFEPVGDYSDKFIGNLDGAGNVVDQLFINRSDENLLGLFSVISTSVDLLNIGMTNVNIIGNNYVGSLVGTANFQTRVSNSYAIGIIRGNDHLGGLIGYASDSMNVDDSYAEVSISGNDKLGGLVGDGLYVIVNNSYATGNINGAARLGGLVGYGYHTEIYNSYATGNINGTMLLGGLLATGQYSVVSNSYATGDVNGTIGSIAGLIAGAAYANVNNSYATGNINGGSFYTGGLLAEATRATVSNSYSTGSVTCTNYLCGGLLGWTNPSLGGTLFNVTWTNHTGDTAEYCVGSTSGLGGSNPSECSYVIA